jgi:hypothetical protein
MAEFIDINCEINNGDKNMGHYLVVFDWIGETGNEDNTEVYGPTEKVNWQEAVAHFAEREEIPLEHPNTKCEVYLLATGLDGEPVKYSVTGENEVY